MHFRVNTSSLLPHVYLRSTTNTWANNHAILTPNTYTGALLLQLMWVCKEKEKKNELKGMNLKMVHHISTP
jgi:hypothetical protein